MSTTTVPDGGDGSDDRWENVGRQLLIEQLELVAMATVRDAFIGAASRLEAGDELAESDIREMREALEDAQRVVEVAAEASPEASPTPDLWQFLDEEGRSEYVQEAEQRRSEDGQ